MPEKREFLHRIGENELFLSFYYTLLTHFYYTKLEYFGKKGYFMEEDFGI